MLILLCNLLSYIRTCWGFVMQMNGGIRRSYFRPPPSIHKPAPSMHGRPPLRANWTPPGSRACAAVIGMLSSAGRPAQVWRLGRGVAGAAVRVALQLARGYFRFLVLNSQSVLLIVLYVSAIMFCFQFLTSWVLAASRAPRDYNARSVFEWSWNDVTSSLRFSWTHRIPPFRARLHFRLLPPPRQ